MTNSRTDTDPLRHLATELRDLEDRGLLRVPPAAIGRSADPTAALVLCSNDYLGYAAEPFPHLLGEVGGAGASRLVAGEHVSHDETERDIADWLHTPASLLFSSGYAANVGAVSSLARPGDVIISDALNHASIIDGCRLSGAQIRVVPHCDLAAVERALSESRAARARWVVTESYFSMDGDSPDLRALRALCDTHDAALYVDEAHAIGVFGPEGRGLCAEAGIAPHVFIGTFGKALGLQGAFVAGTETLRRYLWNRARSFVFSTGISPALSAAIRTNVRRVRADQQGRDRLHARATRLREGLMSLGIPMSSADLRNTHSAEGSGALDGGAARDPSRAMSRGPVLPWLVGSASAAVALSDELRARGILVQAIRPPTVPTDTARLRITATARLTEADVDRALSAFAKIAPPLRDSRLCAAGDARRVGSSHVSSESRPIATTPLVAPAR